MQKYAKWRLKVEEEKTAKYDCDGYFLDDSREMRKSFMTHEGYDYSDPKNLEGESYSVVAHFYNLTCIPDLNVTRSVV